MDTLTSRFTNCSDTEGIGFYYTYNGKGKLVRIEMKSVTIADGAVTGGTLLSSENYLYDGSDRLIRVVETDGDNVVLRTSIPLPSAAAAIPASAVMIEFSSTTQTEQRA